MANAIATKANRRLGRLARTTALAGPALMMVLSGAVPAQAHEADQGISTEATGTVSASAGTSWAQVMRYKIEREAYLGKVAAALPAKRSVVQTHTANLAVLRTAEAAAAASEKRATSTVIVTHEKEAVAKSAVAAAKKALAAAKKKRPYSGSKVTKAKNAVTAAEKTAAARAITAREATAALKAARTVSAAATREVTKTVAAQTTAVLAVSNAEAAIRAWPANRANLAGQATGLSDDVVAWSRGSFTMAQTTKAYGVTVNKVVAYSFQRMIDDAAKSGVQLSGGGFRTRQEQIALRKSNGCPDVFTAPSSSCRVPTAIPGRSLHELGLAIDMTTGGRSINSRNSVAFKWMAANAGKYGFVNLPSEPWHWSINGH